MLSVGREASPFTSTHFEPIRDDGAVFNPYDGYAPASRRRSALNALFRDWRSLDFDVIV